MHSKVDTDIMLSKSEELVIKNKEAANTFNNHFGLIVDNLGLDHWRIIPCFHLKVLIGFIILSNSKKINSA